MTGRVEVISPDFTKFHLGDGRAIHRFTGVSHDQPHDHPWSFRSRVLLGSYVERVYRVGDGGVWASKLITRLTGDEFTVAATHIHQLVALPEGECLTLVTAGVAERDWMFWRFDERVAQSRHWSEM